MDYTIAALLGVLAGAVAARYLDRRIWIAAILVICLIGVLFFRDSLHVFRFLAPSATGAAGGVSELQRMTPVTAWREVGAVSILAIAGLISLAKPVPSLFVLWALTAVILSWMQIRMIYYYAPVAAILAAYFCARKVHKNVAYMALGVVLLHNC